jgi:hypothetical protein
MARNRRAVLRQLSVEQSSFLTVGNLLTRAHRDESDEAAERRLFGSRTTAAAAWEQHRDALLAVDPVPGRRPYGWWRYGRRRRAVPPAEQQLELLRALDCLNEAEVAQLEAGRRMVPEPPDLSLDNSVIDLTITTEETNVEAHPEAGGRTPAVPGGHSDAERADAPEPRVDGAEAPSITAPEHERTDAPDPPGRPVRGARENDMNLLPWPLQKGRNPNEGWLRPTTREASSSRGTARRSPRPSRRWVTPSSLP